MPPSLGKNLRVFIPFALGYFLPYLYRVVNAVLSQSFPLHLSGRVNTGVNLLVFIAAFSAQWGIGAIINLWPGTAAGGYAPPGYQAGFAMMLCLQVIALLWFVAASIRMDRNKTY